MLRILGVQRVVYKRFAVTILAVFFSAGPTESQDLPDSVVIPRNATALEGIPTIFVSSDSNTNEKQVLTAAEASKNRLLVTIVNGKFYWASRGNRPLQFSESGVFTYLSEGPGAYVKFTKVGNKILYMEHANIFLSTLTYWGELKIITGQ